MQVSHGEKNMVEPYLGLDLINPRSNYDHKFGDIIKESFKPLGHRNGPVAHFRTSQLSKGFYGIRRSGINYSNSLKCESGRWSWSAKRTRSGNIWFEDQPQIAPKA